MQPLIFRGLFWLITELSLSMVELDQLADYSEFIFRLRDDMALQREKIVRLMKPKDGYLVPCPPVVETMPASNSRISYPTLLNCHS
jgi:hypothetical protein